MSNAAVKELLHQHISMQPSPSKLALNTAPVNSPIPVTSPASMSFSPTFLPGSNSSGTGAFSAPGRPKDQRSPINASSYPRLDFTVSGSHASNTALLRTAVGAASPLNSSSGEAEAKIQFLQSKIDQESAARLAAEAIADDLNRQLKARDLVIDELHKHMQHLEQQLFSVMSTLERSAEDALQIERAIKSKNGSADDKRRMPLQQQQYTQVRQEPSPFRNSSSNGSAFAPSSGSEGGPGPLSLRSPAVLSDLPAQASAFDCQSSAFIKVWPPLDLFLTVFSVVVFIDSSTQLLFIIFFLCNQFWFLPLFSAPADFCRFFRWLWAKWREDRTCQ
jgi:hypothetical protein